jgi:DNA-binding winged helix-turn-helix (wHTH) protein/tetratricopeptide (TPR) repeat protein
MQRGEDPVFFSFGDWTVRPAQRSIERRDERLVLEPRLIDVLTYLAATGGDVVSAEQLLTDCWRGTFYGDNPVHKTVALLRKALGDDARSPRYIATVRKRGYQVVAPVTFADGRRPGSAVRTWNGGSPYRGLLAFGHGDTDVFFGRARATADVLAAIHRHHHAGCAFVLLTGPSGCGKSSLVHAGVVPVLVNEAGYDGLRAVSWSAMASRAPGLAPLESLAVAMTRWEVRGRPVFVETERRELVHALATDMDFVVRRIALAVSGQGAAPGDVLLLVIDALEGLLTASATPDDTAVLVSALGRLARSGHVVVLALCRNDFYPQLMSVPDLLALKRDGVLYDLAMPGPGEVAQMIRLPAQAAGLHFERDASSERHLDDVLLEAACRHAGSLPLLQYTLQALYESRDATGTLCFAAYLRLGGLEGALGQRAEQVLEGLGANAAAAFPRILHRLVALASDGDEVTAHVVRWRDIDDDERIVLHDLVNARLLVSLLEDDEPCFTVAHEALLRHWPRVVAWIDAHRAMLRSRARIAIMGKRWADEDRRREHLLPRGQLLADARVLYRTAQPPLAEEQRQFIRRSLGHARLRVATMVAMAAVIVVLATVSSIAAVDARRAEHHAEARRADAEGLIDFMLGDMHERLDALGRLDLLDDVTGRAMTVLAHDWQADVPADVLRQARGLRQVGEIRYARGDVDAAEQAFLAADASLRHLFDSTPANAAAFAERGKIDFWRAQIASTRGHADDARRSWLAYLDDATRRATLEPDDPDAWLELSYAHNCLGSAALRADRLDDAIASFHTSVGFKKRVLGMRPLDRTTWLELADTMSWMAAAEQQRGDLQRALRALEEERVAVLAARDEGPPTNRWLYRRALAELHVARAEADLGRVTDAASVYASSADTFAMLVRDVPDNRGWQRDLAWARTQQGWLAFGMGDGARASIWLTEGERLLRSLLTIDARVVDWRNLLALNRTYQSGVLLRQGAVSRALDAAADAARLLSPVPGSKPNSATRLLTASASIAEGEAARALGHADEAILHWRRAIDELQPQALHSRDPRLLEPYIHALLLLGRADEAENHLERLRDAGYRAPAFESFVHQP